MSEQKILIPIKASEELPKESFEGSFITKTVFNGREMVCYDILHKWWFSPYTEDVIELDIWYKPISEDEYKKEIIIDLLNNHLDTWEYANCGNVEEVAQEYINYIKSKLTEK